MIIDRRDASKQCRRLAEPPPCRSAIRPRWIKLFRTSSANGEVSVSVNTETTELTDCEAALLFSPRAR